MAMRPEHYWQDMFIKTLVNLGLLKIDKISRGPLMVMQNGTLVQITVDVSGEINVRK